MSAHSFLRRLAREQGGASAAEFAIILPVFILFLLGIIDAGRYAWGFNRGEKASQIGARLAVVTDPLVNELVTYSYSGQTVDGVTLSQGDRIPQGALGTITCKSTGCTCTVTPCLGGTLTLNTTAFNRLADRVQQFYPEVPDDKIEVDYVGSGLGYAGNPTGMDVAPFVTVRLMDQTFTALILFGASVGFPDFSYTLTMEDGVGSQYN